ncbi:MAG: hypothetical protein ACI84K_001071 [Pseudohongiellaceae bacterium]|jgi:hypothetical protein
MKKTVQILQILTISSILIACNGPFGDYTNFDLKKEYNKCDYNRLSPAGAQRCNNLKKECGIRKEKSGFRC